MFENKEKQCVPDVTFRIRRDHEWIERRSADIFKSRTVIVFSLPGAFTPTCSSTHVPRYNQFAPLFKKLGVDEVICVSVNDSFVMNEWQSDQKAGAITFLPDGNGDFTRGMGMLVSKDDLGFGDRSWRYSMVVKDGVVEKMFIEPERTGDPFEVSDADTMLSHLAPKAAKPLDITVFSRKGCPFCVRAKGLLHDAELDFEELVLNRDFTDRTLRAVAGAASVPQIFINGEHIGGSEQIETWLQTRKAA